MSYEERIIPVRLSKVANDLQQFQNQYDSLISGAFNAICGNLFGGQKSHKPEKQSKSLLGGLGKGFLGSLAKDIGKDLIGGLVGGKGHVGRGGDPYNRIFQSTTTSSYNRYSGSTYRFGERGSGFKPRGLVQDFEKLQQQCISEGTLFEDNVFPATDASVFFSRCPPRPFEWKRPYEICDDPKLFVEGASRFDVVQGELGDCWLLAAVANLTLNPELFFRVVPDDQTFDKSKYTGLFHFRFWQYGKWVDVVVDDRLPTYNGHLIFMHSKDSNEFWSALLEKAYAKLHGSYESLKGGTTCEAMEDFTGGVTEFYEIANYPPNLFKIVLKAYERSSLIGCSIEPDPEVTEKSLANGLIKGHAYSVTSVRMVEIATPRVSGKIPLLRVRNPWGNDCEWKGAWSDQSPEWSVVSKNEREELGLTFEADGEFWMSYKDFISNFDRIEICNLNAGSLEESYSLDGSKKSWETHMFEGSWSKNCTAGGCRNFLETFWMNPQYRIILEDPDDDDEDELCTMIVGLMQKNRRAQRKMGRDCLTIGFAIYGLDDPDRQPKPLDKNFFKYTRSTAKSNQFVNLREVSSRFKLPPGTYCIVPSTFDANEEGDFVLRVFTEKKNSMNEYDNDIGISEPAKEVKVDDTQDVNEEKNNQVKEFFAKLAGVDMEVDSYELKDILNFALKKEFTFDGFTLDVCRSMIATVDIDKSGKLNYEEFLNLWIDIRTWKNVFKNFDHDGSGELNTLELRLALQSAGYSVNGNVLKILVLRYGKNGKMKFDDFITCAIKLKTMIENFRDKDPKKLGRATFTMDEWIERTMYS